MTQEQDGIIDFNVALIIKAIETKTEIILYPRRSHTIKGIPFRLDRNTARIYVTNGNTVESILLSEIGHFLFPAKLIDGEVFQTPKEQAEEIAEILRKEKQLRNLCRNCGKKIPNNLSFCSNECKNEHKKRKKKNE